MTGRRQRSGAVPFLVAASNYALNCALGAAVAARLVDTSGIRWVHHLLYVGTCVTTAIALGLALVRPGARPAALALAPAAAPLAVIPFAGTRGLRHPLVALAAAPFYIAGVVRSRSAHDRK
jgi:hypothetical protein